MNNDLAYWVATSAIPGVGTVTFNYLLATFKTLKKFWEAPNEKIHKLKLDAKTKESIINFRSRVGPRQYLDTVYERKVKVVTLLDWEYPANLRKIGDSPPVLYFRGNLTVQDDFAIAVVGTRHPTVYGRQVTEKLVSELANYGLTIVSGLARGIDSIAHRAALLAGVRTIAVLGSGPDIIYPPENKMLAEKIIQNGAVVSEFPLGFPSVPSNFPSRNRIISGLSRGVLVTEAAIDSGSLITAGQAAEQDRPVFAVPGPIYSKTAEGVNKLIKEGVFPVTNIEDILGILNINKNTLKANINILDNKNLTKLEKQILKSLENGNKHIDTIVRESGQKIELVNSALSIMELNGLVKNYGSGIWGT